MIERTTDLAIREALFQLRNLRTCLEAGAPPLPSLNAAERTLMLLLFPQNDVEAYFAKLDEQNR